MSDWSLEDVERRASKNPALLQIPPIEVRETLEAGWIAALHFVVRGESSYAAEKLWARITKVEDGPIYSGVVTCEPKVLVSTVRRGDAVTFAAKNVLDYVDCKAPKAKVQ